MSEQCFISDDMVAYAGLLLLIIGGGFSGGLLYDLIRGALVYFGVLPKRIFHLKLNGSDHIDVMVKDMLRALSAERDAANEASKKAHQLASQYASQAQALAVTVKPLEWKCNNGNYPIWTAYSDATKTWYKVDCGSPRAMGRFPLLIDSKWTGKKYQTPQQPIDAAEKHNEQRVLSAITARPEHEVRKEALEEAAQWHDEKAVLEGDISDIYAKQGDPVAAKIFRSIVTTHERGAAAIRAMIKEGKE